MRSVPPRQCLAVLVGCLLCVAALRAPAVEPGEIVEVNGYGKWDTIGKVMRADQYGVLVLYRGTDGSYNESTGFTRYFDPKDVRPLQAPAPVADIPSNRQAAPPVSNRSAPPAAIAAFKLGDRVQGWNLGWYEGTVAKVGDGSYAGYYLIKHDKFSQDSYYAQANVRLLASVTPTGMSDPSAQPTTPAAGAAGPRIGTYGCGVFLSGRYTRTQTLSLDGASYTTSHGDGGSYAYDASSQRLNFRGGALAEQVGQYEPDNNAIIRLTRRADLGESSHTQKWRSQVCSPR